jgi:hypothetical protein
MPSPTPDNWPNIVSPTKLEGETEKQTFPKVLSIDLLSVAANDFTAMFKLRVNYEGNFPSVDKVFIGKQDELFTNIDPSNPSTSNPYKNTRINSILRTLDSFQKTYIEDKLDNKRKDVIIPVAVSNDLAQFGNYLFTLSTRTNNVILYLLWKANLINKYESENNNAFFYTFSDKLIEEAGSSDPDRILKYLAETNFSFDNDTNGIGAFEQQHEYTWDGFDWSDMTVLESMGLFPQDLKYNSGIYNTNQINIPRNLLMEYQNDWAYENKSSTIYSNFISLKNHLSPFFNIEFEKNTENNSTKNNLKLFREYKKIENGNDTIWLSYKLNTSNNNTIETPEDPSAPTPINQLLKNVEEFDFIDNVAGVLKLKNTIGKKSNLFSIEITNSGLGEENPYDPSSKEYKEWDEFITSCKTILEQNLYNLTQKIAPIHTQLYKVIFKEE